MILTIMVIILVLLLVVFGLSFPSLPLAKWGENKFGTYDGYLTILGICFTVLGIIAAITAVMLFNK